VAANIFKVEIKTRRAPPGTERAGAGGGRDGGGPNGSYLSEARRAILSPGTIFYPRLCSRSRGNGKVTEGGGDGEKSPLSPRVD